MDTEVAAIQRWIEKRDSEAFRTLVVQYSSMVYATCRRVMGNAADAEDAAQESFQALAMLRQAPKGGLGPWLHRVAVYKSLNQLRADARRVKRGQAYAKQAAAAEPVWDDLYQFVDDAIADLPEKYRQPLVRHFLQCETQDAIAQSMGLTRQTAAYRIQCGLEGIRKSLRRKGVSVTAAVLGGLLTANAVEAAPATLIESLGKMALMGPSIPVQPMRRMARIQSKVFSLKGAVAIFIVAGAIIAGGINGSYYWEMYSIKHQITSSKEHAQQPPAKSGPAMPQRPLRAFKRATVVTPEFEPAAPEESAKNFAAPGTVPAWGELRGCLRGESGAPMAGVEVVLTRTQTTRWGSFFAEKTRWTVLSDAEGRFVFSDLPVCADNILRGRQNFRLSAELNGHYADTEFQQHFWEFSRFQELVLRPVSFLECTVLNEQGVPAPCGRIQVEDASRLFRQQPAPEPVDLGTDGRATIGPLFPGTYKLKVSAAGYASTEHVAGHNAGQVQVVLKPQPAILGRVLDAATGAPVADVKILAKAEGSNKPVGYATSNAAGDYFVSLKTEMEVLLYAYAGDMCLAGGWLKVQADPRIGKSVDLELVQGGTISGHALDPITGKGVPNIPVCFSYGDTVVQDGFNNAYTDENGAYTLRAVCGKGAVKMLDWWDSAYARPLEIEAGQAVENVDFTLARGSRVAGRVVNTQNQPQAGVMVAVQPIRNPEQRTLQYNLRYMASSADNAGGLTDADGRFVCFLRGNTGSIYLQALGKDCASAKLGPFDVPETGLASLLVRVEPTGGLDGCIVNEQSQPVSGASVALQPVDAGRDSMLSDVEWPAGSGPDGFSPPALYRITAMGGFAFRGVLPGKYRVMGFVNGSPPSGPLAEQEVTIEAGAVETVQLAAKMAGLSGVRGVVMAQGRPQPNLRVDILHNETVEDLITTTGADGSYAFNQLPGKKAWLVVSNPDKHDSLAEAHVELVPGQVITQDIEVPVGTGRVEGYVRMSGTPATDKELFLMPFDGADGQTLSAKTDLQGRFSMDNVVAGVYVLGIMKPGGYGANPTQSLVYVAEGQTVQHNFNIGGAAITVDVQGVKEEDRGHIVIVRGETVIEELTEESLMALAPQAVKYVRTTPGVTEYSFSELGAGIYVVYAGACPRETREGEDVLGRMRVLYSVVNAADKETALVAFDFNTSDEAGDENMPDAAQTL